MSDYDSADGKTAPVTVTLTQLREALGDEYLAKRPSFERAAARVRRRSGIEMTREDFERLKNGLRNLEELLNEGKVDRSQFKVRKYTVNSWGKDGDHFQVKAHLVPIENELPIQQLRPAVRKTFTTRQSRPHATAMEILCIPDIHFGYRVEGVEGRDPVLEPLHDEGAVYIVMQVAEKYQPHTIVLLGDLLDLPALSKFLSDPQLKHLVQPAIDAAGTFLETLRECCPKARIVMLKGNHEERIDTQLKALLPELFGVRRANEQARVLDLAYLLHFEELNIEYVAPYGRRFYVGSTMFHHGETVGRRGGDTVSKLLALLPESTVCGHVHRLELAYETTHTRHGEHIRYAMSCGTLARTDGIVPGGMYPNWQKGFGAIWFGNVPHVYPIINNGVVIDGHLLSALAEPESSIPEMPEAPKEEK